MFETLQVYLGSLYVNDFNRFGRTYQVNVQAEQGFRLQPEQIGRLKTRNAGGEMVPLGSLVTVKQGYGPDQVMHYNGFPAAEINGGPAPGHSSGQAQAAIASILQEKLPGSMTVRVDRAGVSGVDRRQHDASHVPAVRAAGLRRAGGAVRSWTLPLSVILIVPMTLLSALAGVWLTGGDSNVFTQISFLVLSALACKNAILIVEFAKQREHEGERRINARFSTRAASGCARC